MRQRPEGLQPHLCLWLGSLPNECIVCGLLTPRVPVFIRDLTILSGCVSQLAHLPCLHKARIIASNTQEGTPALPSSPPSIFPHLDYCNLLTAPLAPILAPSFQTQHGLSLSKKKNQNHFFLYFWLHWIFIAVHGLSLVAANAGNTLVAVHGLLLWSTRSRVLRLF